MSICACLIVNAIHVYKVYQVAFCFTIDMVDEKMVVSFRYAFKIEL